MNPKFKLLLFFQFVFLMAWGQLSRTKLFSSQDGLCSTSLLLDSLGNFYKEGGCEGRSHISMGTYKFKDGKVDFTFEIFSTSQPVFSNEVYSLSSDSLITVTFLTRQGKPVLKDNFSVDAIDSSGKFFETIQLDDHGQIKVNFKKYKELRLPYLENIYAKKIRISTNNRHMTVILNLPQLFLYYPSPRPEIGTNFSLRLKNDGFYEMTGNKKVLSIKD